MTRFSPSQEPAHEEVNEATGEVTEEHYEPVKRSRLHAPSLILGLVIATLMGAVSMLGYAILATLAVSLGGGL